MSHDLGGRAPRHRSAGAAIAVGFLLALLPVVGGAEPGDRIGEVFGTRVELQRQLGGLLEQALKPLADPYRCAATVRVTLRGEARDLVQKDEAPGSELKIGSHKAMKLPGLPTVDKPLTGVAAPDISVKIPGRSKAEVHRLIESHVDRVSVRLFVEKGAPAELLERLKQTASELAGIDSGRGDTVEVLSDLAPQPVAAKDPLPRPLLVGCLTALVSALLLAGGLAIGRRRSDGAGGSTRVALEGEFGERIEDRVAGTVGDAALAPADPGQPEDTRPFAFLRAATAEERLEVLSEIEPVVAAAVLDQIGVDSDTVKVLFQRLTPERQVAMALQLGRSRIVPRATIAEMEQSTRAALERSRSRMRVGGEGRLADLLALAPEASQRELLERIAERDPALAQAIRGKMLLFEDLARLDDGSVRQIAAAVGPATVALALAGASLEVNEAVMRSVSKRLRAILDAEVEALHDKPATEIEAARKSIERVMRGLQAKGELRERAAAA